MNVGRRSFTHLAAAAILASMTCGCDSSDVRGDAGADDVDAASFDAAPSPCARAADCEDGLFCTEHRCEPGAAAADPRTGCVLVEDGACGGGMRCLEEHDRCVPEGCAGLPDADGDGHDSVACGGDDCDDFDSSRHPGRGETCDPDGRDEDCDDTTFGDRDTDGDGYVDAACCNGGRCAADCDDADRVVAPGATESCNGRDDDCDGSVDESSEPLCPGGLCLAGRCDLAGWDRTFGGAGFDVVGSIAMDAEGHVYISGMFADATRFGGELITSRGSNDAFLASYGADGSFRWVIQLGSVGWEIGRGVAYDPVTDLVYLVVTTSEGGDLGHSITASPNASLVIGVEPSGNVRSGQEVLRATTGNSFGGTSLLVEVSAYGGFIVSGAVADTATLAESIELSPAGAHDGLVAAFDTDGSYRWHAVLRGREAARVEPSSVFAAPAGGAYVTGQVGGSGADLGRGFQTNETPEHHNVFVVALDEEGTSLWDYWVGGNGDVAGRALALGASERLYVAGDFVEPADFGEGPIGAPGSNGVVLAFENDGTLFATQTWAWEAGEATAIAAQAGGGVAVAGTLRGSVDLGGGMRPGPTEWSGAFYVLLDPELIHRADGVFPAPSCPQANCPSEVLDIAVGPADSTAMAGLFGGTIDLGSGPRLSAGNYDGFVVRLAN